MDARNATFGWRPGSRIRVPAKVAGPELLRLAGDRGVEGLDPKKVVASARPTTSPLHKAIYRLSDGQAAYQHRLEIARDMLSSLVVTMTIEDRAPIQYRPFVSLQDGKGYRSAVAVEADDDLRVRRIENALRYLDAARRMLAEAKGFADVCQALLRIQARLDRRRHAAKRARRAA